AIAVQKLLNWRFTKDIADHFVPRLVRKGYLKRTEATQNRYLVTYSPPDEVQTDSLPIANILEKVADEFEQFPSRVTELLNYTRTREQLKEILINFLVSLDAYAEPNLLAEMDRLQIGGEDRSILAGLEEGGRPLARDDRYMCARFVTEMIQK